MAANKWSGGSPLLMKASAPASRAAPRHSGRPPRTITATLAQCVRKTGNNVMAFCPRSVQSSRTRSGQAASIWINNSPALAASHIAANSNHCLSSVRRANRVFGRWSANRMCIYISVNHKSPGYIGYSGDLWLRPGGLFLCPWAIIWSGDQPLLDRQGDGLRPVSGIQFGENIADVNFDSRAADAQALGNLGVGQSFDQQ